MIKSPITYAMDKLKQHKQNLTRFRHGDTRPFVGQQWLCSVSVIKWGQFTIIIMCTIKRHEFDYLLSLCTIVPIPAQLCVEWVYVGVGGGWASKSRRLPAACCLL